MKESKKTYTRLLAVFALLLLCIIALAGLGIHYLRQDDTDASSSRREELIIKAPRLSAAADAFLLIHDGDAILIDTGEEADGDSIVGLLQENHIDHLKALILTHYDKDHIGGAAVVLRQISVDQCYMPCGSEDSDLYASLMDALDENGCEQIMLTAKTTFSELGGEISIYPPLKYTYPKNTDNNRSLIVTMAYEGEELLFAGDAQKTRMDEFLEKQYDGTAFDFVKIPYHGRGVKTVKALLEAFTPSCALITSSEEEPADEEATGLLDEAGVSVWYPKDGDVTMKVYYDTISITQGDQSETYTAKNDDEESTDTEDGKSDTNTDTGDGTSDTKEKISATNADTKEKASDDKTEESEESVVEAPTFSKDSGFYDDSFDLTIDAPEGTTVYYTLDSSTPTTKSTAYKKAITITDPSSDANVYSARTDFEPYVSVPLYEGKSQVIPGYYTRYLIPDDPVDKCMVVRAMAVDEAGNCSKVTTASYFIGYDQKEGYEDVSVLSIVSDPDGLFSSDDGIMVNGSTYEEKLKNGELDGIDDTHVLRKYTNTYAGRGRDWERETHIDFFGEEDLGLVFSQEAGIRLHGNQSRVAINQKSFNLYAREEYDGNGTFLSSFFEDGILSDTVTLMRGNDLRNYYLSSKMNGRDMDAQQYRMVQVFLDGEYWGLYAIQERYSSSQYMKTHYGLDKGEYNLFSGGPKGFKCKKGDEKATKTSFVMLKDYLADQDLSDPQVYEKVCSMMDVQSFIDVYAARIYLSDQDWNWFKNQYILYYDNKWHWLVYDVDYGTASHDTSQASMDTFTSSRLSVRFSLANDPLFSHLMKNEQFREDFVNTFMDLANDVFSATRAKKDKDAFLEQYWKATLKSMERYPVMGESVAEDKANHDSSYARAFDEVEDYFEDRYDYAVQYLKNYFGLSGELARVTVSVTVKNSAEQDDSGKDSSGQDDSEKDGGTVKINTITPSLGDKGSWSGKYYTDYPVTVTAIASEGYVFEGWQCEDGTIVDESSATTQLSFTKDTKITAVFSQK